MRELRNETVGADGSRKGLAMSHLPRPTSPRIGALLRKEQDVDALSRYDTQGGRYPARWAVLGPRFNQ